MLAEIEKLDVSKFSELDVRSEVIDPIVRALGYKKQTYFSLEREKPLKILNKDLRVDYSFTLMHENFWVIEAKKVNRKALRFTAAELEQALIYAAHPEINAALLVLCDGRILHVFDREESLTSPILEIEIEHLVRDFDKLRTVLSPWQLWFFEKRRIVRMIDKVFDREPNMERREEFRALVDTRLRQKRITVLQNYQNLGPTLLDRDRLEHIKSCHYTEIIGVHFFRQRTAGELNAMSHRLTEFCKTNAFHVLHAIFPDSPRDTNDLYWGAALHFLLWLDREGVAVHWVPGYLRDVNSTEGILSTAINQLIRLCLTTFASDHARRIVQLYAASARRLAKQLNLISPDTEAITSLQHALVRHHLDELSFSQYTSTSRGHRGALLDANTIRLTEAFVSGCTSSDDDFNVDKALLRLKDIWRSELLWLGDGENYRLARNAHSIEDMPGSEFVNISYDNLGHHCLCMLNQFPNWRSHAMTTYKDAIESVARHGSWQARKWLGIADDEQMTRLTTKDLADRFFLGDEDVLLRLASGYGVKL
ncbi:hypothetical protein ACN9MY_06230 [Pseudoduganella sp. R-31]|uniref:hypothetical protein n=1 Tax=Pseudoduganella sp. R-31 TaxID=3404060 RepID=UPI003CF13B6F